MFVGYNHAVTDVHEVKNIRNTYTVSRATLKPYMKRTERTPRLGPYTLGRYLPKVNGRVDLNY